MKRTLLALAVAMLTGCASLDGLSVNFDATITYRSDVPAGKRLP